MIKWLFSWCGKKREEEEKKVVTFVSLPPPKHDLRRAAIPTPTEIPYDLQSKACRNLDSLHKAVLSVNGSQLQVRVRRATREFTLLDEKTLKSSVHAKTEMLRLAAYDEDAFWSLAYLCNCKSGAMERWLLQL